MPLQEEPIHSLHVTSPSLSSLSDFPTSYAQRLQRAGFTTASEIILTTPESLKSQTGLSPEEVREIYHCLSVICSPKVSTVSERIAQDACSFISISLGTSELDRVFGSPPGGIPTGLLTEIAGEAASGKTCCSLQLSLHVQLPFSLGGLEGGCVYLCTESTFPSSRLHQMAVGLTTRLHTAIPPRSCRPGNAEPGASLTVSELMENIHLLRAHDPPSLIHTVHYVLPAFLKKHNCGAGPEHPQPKPIKLIVLDSIGAIFRVDLEHGPATTEQGNLKETKLRMTERAAEMNQVADGLKFLAATYQVAVVVVNQVSDAIERGSASDSRGHPTPAGVGEMEHRIIPDAPTPSSSLHSTPTRTLSSTPTSFDPDGLPVIPLDYQKQATHFTGKKVTNHQKEAALGLVWTNAINIRIMLHKTNIALNQYLSTNRLGDNKHQISNTVRLSPPSIRNAVVVFSPFGKTPVNEKGQGVQFVIDSLGIMTVDDYLQLS